VEDAHAALVDVFDWSRDCLGLGGCNECAESEFMSSTWRVLPLFVLPLAATLVLSANELTGMETMLANLLSAVFVGLTLSWRRGVVRPEVAALSGLLL
jgi:hypothetical protein